MVFKAPSTNLREGVKVETALASYSFTTKKLQISCYVGDTLIEKDAELARKFHLEPFTMNVQSLSRTFIDKVYASCDYYIQGKSRRLSRHLYDLYKISPGKSEHLSVCTRWNKHKRINLQILYRGLLQKRF